MFWNAIIKLKRRHFGSTEIIIGILLAIQLWSMYQLTQLNTLSSRHFLNDLEKLVPIEIWFIAILFGIALVLYGMIRPSILFMCAGYLIIASWNIQLGVFVFLEFMSDFFIGFFAAIALGSIFRTADLFTEYWINRKNE